MLAIFKTTFSTVFHDINTVDIKSNVSEAWCCDEGYKAKSSQFHTFLSFFGPPIPELNLFQTLTLKLQGQGHGCCPRARLCSQPSI